MTPRAPGAALLALACAGAPLACAEAHAVEATSLLGEELSAPELPADRRDELEAKLMEARRVLGEAPGDEAALIWVGRRQAYLGRYREALATFSEGLRLHPESARLLRHRGHRWITVRELGNAVQDLERALELVRDRPDEIEPDGQPNAAGVPRSTLKTNVTYHLGLAHYLLGDFAASARVFRLCHEWSPNDDMRVAAAFWLRLALERSGSSEEARRLLETIEPEMDLLENEGYQRLLLHAKGELSEDELLADEAAGSVARSTLEHGLGAQALVSGHADAARRRFESVLSAGVWPAFGHVAAEAELARLRREGAGVPSR